MSKSSIDEDIRQVRKKLAHYQVEVLSIPKQSLQFQAKEQFIRTMLFSILSSVLVDEDQGKKQLVYKYLDKECLHHLDAIYSSVISQVEVSPYRINFNLLAYIWLDRLSRGSYSAPSTRNMNYKEKMIVFTIISTGSWTNLGLGQIWRRNITFIFYLIA